MRRIRFKYIAMAIAVCLLCFVTACSCGGDKSLDYSTAETSLKETHLTSIVQEIEKVLNNSGATEEEKNSIVSEIRKTFNGSNGEEVINTALVSFGKVENVDETKNTINSAVVIAVKTKAISLLNNFFILDDLKTHQKEICTKQVIETENELNKAVKATTQIVNNEIVDNSHNVYQILSNHYIKIQTAKTQNSPIRIFNIKEDGFFSTIFNNFLVYPIGWLLQFISGLFGGYYIVGLLIVTILIRTIMMPVYNSTNNMSLKMQLMQPELQKLEAKYANRPDQQSQQAKQMEQMQLYKKYKMGFGGCLPMLLQFPVFLSVYQAVSRIHLTDGTICNSPNWVEGLETKFLGIDLFLNRGENWKWQFWGVIIVLVLVVGTQILQQVLTTYFQKATYARSQENIPEYKRKAMQQNQTNGSMKFMMYFMIFMMGVFVFQSAAGLGIYWLIGNVYSLIQMLINYLNSDKKLEKLKKKLNV